MKRLRHILFNVLATVSALLCAAMVALWVRSARHFDLVTFTYQSKDMLDTCYIADLGSDGGQLRYRWRHKTDVLIQGPRFEIRRFAKDVSKPLHGGSFLRNHGFEFSYDPDSFSADLDIGQRLVIAGPHWLPVILLTWIPCLWLKHFLRAAAQGTNYCTSCGYDLRGTSDRCPECVRDAARCPALWTSLSTGA